MTSAHLAYSLPYSETTATPVATPFAVHTLLTRKAVASSPTSSRGGTF